MSVGSWLLPFPLRCLLRLAGARQMAQVRILDLPGLHFAKVAADNGNSDGYALPVHCDGGRGALVLAVSVFSTRTCGFLLSPSDSSGRTRYGTKPNHPQMVAACRQVYFGREVPVILGGHQ